MNLLLVTLGSYGDVHPFVGLGRALAGRGHRVTVLTNEHFRPLIEAEGLGFGAIGTAAEYLELAKNSDLWHPVRGSLAIVEAVAKSLPSVYEAVQTRLEGDGSDVVVGSTLAMGARIARDKWKFPLATVHLAPVVFRSEYAPPVLPGVPAMVNRLPRWALRRFYDGADRFVIDPRLGPAVNGFRASLGLGPVTRIMHAWWNSPDLTLGLWPAWYAPKQPDWPANTLLTDFPLYDEAGVTPLPDDLRAFLDAGDPPVAFTPGSAMLDGRAFFDAAAGACRRLAVRGVLLTRHPQNVPPALPEGVIHVEYAPFSRLLPRCAALVHHGGIGTLSQALAAGVPQVVLPMAHDQPDNATRLKRLGVARVLSPRRPTARRLSRALRRALHGSAVTSARSVANRLLAGPGGTDLAADAIERLGHTHPSAVLHDSTSGVARDRFAHAG